MIFLFVKLTRFFESNLIFTDAGTVHMLENCSIKWDSYVLESEKQESIEF